MLLGVIANDRNAIPYRKELNVITGGIIPTLVLQQIIYWWGKNGGQPFYKFIEPCDHKLYRDGDSWTEEIGISKKQFISAFKKLSATGICSKKIDMNRVTLYSINEEILEEKLKNIYNMGHLPKGKKCTPKRAKSALPKVPKGNLVYIDTETTTEITTENNKYRSPDQSLDLVTKHNLPVGINNNSDGTFKSPDDKFRELWNKKADKYKLPKIIGITKARKSKLKARIKEELFDFDKILENINDNTPILIGKNKSGWKISFDWIIKNDTNYLKVIEGNYIEAKQNNSKQKEKANVYHDGTYSEAVMRTLLGKK